MKIFVCFVVLLQLFVIHAKEIIIQFKDDVHINTALKELKIPDYSVFHQFNQAFKGILVDVEESDFSSPFIDQQIEISRNRVWRGTSVPWGLDRIDQLDLPLDGVYSPLVNGSGVDVFVVDSGIDLTHIEFSNSEERNLSNPFAFYGNLSSNTDQNGHGTRTASVAGGLSVGVSSEVNVVGIKVLDDSGGGSDASVLAGLDFILSSLPTSSRRSIVLMAIGGWCGSYKCEDDPVGKLFDLSFKQLRARGAIRFQIFIFIFILLLIVWSQLGTLIWTPVFPLLPPSTLPSVWGLPLPLITVCPTLTMEVVWICGLQDLPSPQPAPMAPPDAPPTTNTSPEVAVPWVLLM